MAAFGSTIVGGRAKPGLVRLLGATHSATIWAEHMYVQYMLPLEKRHPYPIVLVHGGGGTGKVFEERPDGGEGWVNFFVRQGFDTYWVDKPSRGRSGFDPTEINRAAAEQDLSLLPEIECPVAIEMISVEEYAAMGYGAIATHEEALEGVKASVPDMTASLEGARNVGHGGPVVEQAIIQLLEKIGPAILLGHSQGGGEIFGPLKLRPELVAGLVAVEPAVPPRDDFASYAAAPILNLWVEDRIAPEEMLTANAREAHVFSKGVNAAGGQSDVIVLNDLGIAGNGHMMMQNSNSDEIAQVIANWICNHIDDQS